MQIANFTLTQGGWCFGLEGGEEVGGGKEKTQTLGACVSFVEYSGLEPLTSTLPVSRSSRMS